MAKTPVNTTAVQEAEYKDLFFTLFPGLGEELIRTIKSEIQLQTVRKNGFIYREGDTPQGFLCLLHGSAKVVTAGVTGRSQIIRLVKPTGILGYRALFAGENYRFSAKALDTSVIGFIGKAAFSRIVRSNGEVALHILRAIASELGFSNIRTVALTQKYVRGRLADSLLFLIDLYGLTPDGLLAVSLSREDLGQLSSMTTSNAIRTLSAFSSEGIIALIGKRIKILERDRLEKISERG
ncbi:MAG: Crp/Fnr family transcriptional regulator [Rikenellaceae bacterium]|jgi:CRP-like cAMP-binding protein|nr:Crp/Fnr family transcriptional regulator [Rikenellaceae bacterium]